MATIAENLNTLQVIKLDIKDAIISKGGSASDDFRTYANAIEELPSGGGDDTLGKLMKNELTTYNIPNGVTSVRDNLFDKCSSLTSVTIPNSITSIGNNAFWSCYRLTSIDIPNSVTNIGGSAFASCSGLTSIDIPNSVTNISSSVFSSTKNLANVYCHWLIPPTKGEWFSGTYTGGTLHVPNGSSEYYTSKWTGGTNTLFSSTLHWNIVEDMGDYTPSNVLIAKYNVTDTTTATKIFGSNNKFASGATSASTGSLIWIEETPSMYSGSGYTFASIGEKEIRIDSCPSTIPQSAFASCSGLTSVTIPNSVTSIGQSAFASCSGLTSVTIPNSVTSIGQSAFDRCTSLTSINYNGTKAQFTAITKGTNWKTNVPTSCIVHCTDGDYPITNFS